MVSGRIDLNELFNLKLCTAVVLNGYGFPIFGNCTTCTSAVFFLRYARGNKYQELFQFVFVIVKQLKVKVDFKSLDKE